MVDIFDPLVPETKHLDQNQLIDNFSGYRQEQRGGVGVGLMGFSSPLTLRVPGVCGLDGKVASSTLAATDTSGKSSCWVGIGEEQKGMVKGGEGCVGWRLVPACVGTVRSAKRFCDITRNISHA